MAWKRLSRATCLYFFIIAVVVIIFYQLLKKISDVSDPSLQARDEALLRPSGIPVLVMVFYEALCPDSKNFIVRQLLPAYRKAPQLIDAQLVPYGKATTSTNADGSLAFDCQHGPIECEANIIHACCLEAIHDPRVRLSMIACMIRDNLLPKDVFYKCGKENAVDVESIQKCFDSPHGAELLKIHGEATNALRPKVSFIPTVTLDGAQGRQASILKDLFSEVCKIAGGHGVMPEVCEN